jgi:hypothetical protein
MILWYILDSTCFSIMKEDMKETTETERFSSDVYFYKTIQISMHYAFVC